MTSRLVPGKPGQLDVYVDGERIEAEREGFLSRLLSGGVPDETKLLAQLRARCAS